MTPAGRIEIDGVEYVRAYPVTDGRCAHCGTGIRSAWLPGDIVEALQVWTAAHGRPPRAFEWATATPNHPHNTAVLLAFGTWNQGLIAAGLNPRKSGARQEWTRENIVVAMREWRETHGRWPVTADWRRSAPEHPVMSTVIRVCGSWNAARKAAGYRGHPKAHARKMTIEQPDSRIDAEPVRELLRRVDAAELAGIADQAEVSGDYLYRIRRGDISTVRLSYADRIVTALDRPDALVAA